MLIQSYFLFQNVAIVDREPSFTVSFPRLDSWYIVFGYITPNTFNQTQLFSKETLFPIRWNIKPYVRLPHLFSDKFLEETLLTVKHCDLVVMVMLAHNCLWHFCFVYGHILTWSQLCSCSANYSLLITQMIVFYSRFTRDGFLSQLMFLTHAVKKFI